MLNLFIALPVAYVIALARHFHSVNRHLGAEPRNIASRSVRATTGSYALRYKVCVFTRVIIEGRTGPMCLGRR